MGGLAILGARAGAIRRVATQYTEGGAIKGGDGIRSLGRPQNSEAWWQVLLGNVAGGIASATTWLIGMAGNLISFSATAVWGAIVGGTMFLINFNWNTTDDEFEAAIQGRERAWYGQLGETFGTAAGWFLCGVVPSLVMGVFNEKLMLHVLSQVSDEAFEEVSSELYALLQAGARHQMSNLGARLFMGLRALIKRAAAGESDSLLGGVVTAILDKFPKTKEAIAKWGEKGQKPWSISGAINEWVESFPEGNFKEFLEEFIEALGESCIEAGYVVAGGIDDFVMQQRLAQEQINGPDRVVECLLDRSDPGSRVIVAGPEKVVLKTLIEQKNTYQLLKQHDMGLLVGGEPVASNITTPGLPWARIVFSASKTKKVKPTYIDIHNLDRTKWDNWEAIKLACGGPNGYMWGPYLVTAILPDNNTINCYAASENEGEELIERLLPLATSGSDPTSVIWVSKHEMRKGSRRKYDSTYKLPRRQYPWEFTIVNPTRVLNEENGKANRSGIYKDRDAFIKLWPDIKPADFNEKITELFRTPGLNG